MAEVAELYEAYIAVAAEGNRIGLMACKRCGCVVMLEKGKDSPEVHERWHERYRAPEAEERK